MDSGSCSRPVFFLIRSLERGGAERQLTLLATALARQGWQVAVVLFYGGGPFAAELEEAGVRLIVLEKGGRWDVLSFFIRLARLLRKERPTLLHGYLTVPNLLVALLKPLLPGTRIVWGLRASNMDLSRYDWLARLTAFVERLLARIPDVIIANSHAGKIHAVGQGFPSGRIEVIPNGIDTVCFAPDAAARQRVRSEWGIAEDAILVGLAARLDAMKGHSTFLHAAGLVANKYPHVRFVCVGNGSAEIQRQLQEQSRQAGLAERLIWAGVRADMPAVYSALDIACSSSSFGEGFSNSIAEAMACGAPCVVTDVGDSAWIVGKTGIVVPPGNSQALADTLMRLIVLSAEQRVALGAHARDRIVAEFGVEALVTRTEQILDLTR